jgi:hypothetical protein
MPNNDTLQATERGELDFSCSLSEKARTAVILPGPKSASLISFGKLCDDNYEVLLTKHKMYAVKNNKIILEGNRNFGDKLWDIAVQKTKLSPFPLDTTPRHASIYGNSSRGTPIIKKIRPKIRELPTSFKNMFASMDALIQVHECNNLVDEQLKKDRQSLYNHEFANLNAIIDDHIKIEYAMLNTNDNQKLNVIIRKKRTQSELSYLFTWSMLVTSAEYLPSGHREESLHNLARSHDKAYKAPLTPKSCNYTRSPAP